ncbi:class I mannose-6-phosphate isomerase [Photobacterium rosenbergii]|uniref:Class I mannose-6-phosphate isomerase n=1 Tax=Photobacterium rosenbergii TaxID=294936 RepID=A0ABU3ZIC5_9GAMM|nr:class I mannose-6-phosphate isomerase [Photobacterium rosenbergii]MDV5169867.1 class I mannose-6-phosphate isomerase [Photobacterium rosenbergii]
MSYLNNQKANYDKFPHIDVAGFAGQSWQGWDNLFDAVDSKVHALGQDKTVLVVDCYPGVNLNDLEQALAAAFPQALLLCSEQAKYPEEKIFAMIERHITDDRVFGVIAPHKLVEFFDDEQVYALKRNVHESQSKLVVVYGPGASLIHDGDVHVYADLARWEIQQRYRRGEIGNWGVENNDEDVLRRYKRAFFIEWRVFDRYKTPLLKRTDFLLDTNVADTPKLISGEAFRAGLDQATNQPFRLVPFFDPGVWGGQWMKEVCDLDPDKPNYAWCFDCVPEENSLYLMVDGIRVEIPSQDLVMLQPRALLGEEVHARFGAEFPIRFDFLDTMQGQNLSLQVHPLTEYIQQEFGMHYTQDESYYMLDAGDDATVYLGVKNDVDPDAMMADLQAAQRGEKSFDDERFINKFPAKKHDHFLIPAGTIHCSGSNAMVLEISATPYIFTFKLWDWDRLGMDGLPRPVHLEHGKEVIQWDRDTDWTEENLVNRVDFIGEGDGWREERTGLHEREFIETRRHWFSKAVTHHTGGNVNVLNLIEGREAVVESPTGAFEPYVVHYAETFVIPASVGEYVIRPYGESEGQEIATIKAYVRN